MFQLKDNKLEKKYIYFVQKLFFNILLQTKNKILAYKPN